MPSKSNQQHPPKPFHVSQDACPFLCAKTLPSFPWENIGTVLMFCCFFVENATQENTGIGVKFIDATGTAISNMKPLTIVPLLPPRLQSRNCKRKQGLR